MQPIEIVVIVISVLIVVAVLGNYIYKKVTHKNTGCSGCSGCNGCSNCSGCNTQNKNKDEEQK